MITVIIIIITVTMRKRVLSLSSSSALVSFEAPSIFCSDCGRYQGAARAVPTDVNTQAVEVLQLLQSLLKTYSAVTAPASVTVSAVVTNVGALVVSAYTSMTRIDNQS